MTEVTPAPAPAPAAPAAATAATTATAPVAPEAVKPPWGDDPTMYDPAKAWAKIQGQASDLEKLRARPVMTPEQQQQLARAAALEESLKTDAQRLQDAAAAAQRDAETAKTQALRLQVALDHGISKEDLVMLKGSTEEELAQAAQWIAAKNAAAATPPVVPAVPPVPGQRPVEQLRPGATPTAAQTEDAANYERLFGPGSWGTAP